MTTPHLQNPARLKNGTTYLIKGKDRGLSAWYYISVPRHQQRLFEEYIAAGNTDLSRYGTLLESGWGKEPPEDVRARMEQM